MKDKSKLIAILLAIVTIVVLILTSVFGKKDNVEKKDIRLVTNYSNFYTVSSCLYRTITYINSKDINSLLLILTDKYKKDNNINENNVLDIFPNMKDSSSFNPKKMYYETVTNDVTKYYVYGYIEKEELIENVEVNKPDRTIAYFVVYLDSAKKIFSIEPYSGEVFMDGETDE